MVRIRRGDWPKVALWFLGLLALSGFLHELGHIFACRTFYGPEECMIGFGFGLCGSPWPICVGYPYSFNAVIGMSGGLFAGAAMMLLYALYKRLSELGNPLAFVIGSMMFILAFILAVQGLQEGLLPDVYAEQLSLANMLILAAGACTGGALYLFLNREILINLRKKIVRNKRV